jgi:nucleotide-binding universal stress UspA family protein
MLNLQTILHPTDFSACSLYAWDLACALAHDHGARLVVLHARELPPSAHGDFGCSPAAGLDSHFLAEELARLEPCYTDVVVYRRLVDGDPAKAILNAAKENHCDVVVMGSHGRTGLGRLLMGSVAEEVVRKAPCPVLVVKAPLAEATLRVTTEEELVAW